MWRLYYLVFQGEPRANKEVFEHVHEPAGVIINPLVVLALLALAGGLLGIPEIFGGVFGLERPHSLSNFLTPVWPAAEPHHIPEPTELLMMGVAIGIALLGWFVAYR